MGSTEHKKPEEIEELRHEPWDGFRQAFYIVFGIGVFWLFYLFTTASGSGGH